MRYRLVCLDAGFTILAPRRTLADAVLGVLAEHGMTAGEEELRAAWEAANAWFWEEYRRPGNDTWGDDARIEATWRRYHLLLLEKLGLRGRDELVERVLAAQFAVDSWELYPDVMPFLEAIRERGLAAGVISDWGSSLPSVLQALGTAPYLDFVLASGAVGVAKPRPAFYRMALERAGVSGSEAVMIGDSYEADVAGARSAGMDGILLVRPDGGGGPIPDPLDAPRISSLEEVMPLLDGERGA